MSLNFNAQMTDFRRHVSIWAIDELGPYKVGVPRPVVFEQRDALDYGHAEPLLTMSVASAQVLVDALWACGLRPTEGSGSAGALAATERHLADLQEIVRVTLNAALPGADE